MSAAIANMTAAAKAAADVLPYEGAVGYRQKIYDAISGQKFPAQGPSWAYGAGYAKWKMAEVGHLRFWELYGDLKGSLRVFKIGTDWAGGVPPGAVSTRGESISEYGERVEKKRPLFGPAAEQYADNEWKDMCVRALDLIGSHWK
jgi:hypothetical protein